VFKVKKKMKMKMLKLTVVTPKKKLNQFTKNIESRKKKARRTGKLSYGNLIYCSLTRKREQELPNFVKLGSLNAINNLMRREILIK